MFLGDMGMRLEGQRAPPRSAGGCLPVHRVSAPSSMVGCMTSAEKGKERLPWVISGFWLEIRQRKWSFCPFQCGASGESGFVALAQQQRCRFKVSGQGYTFFKDEAWTKGMPNSLGFMGWHGM